MDIEEAKDRELPTMTPSSGPSITSIVAQSDQVRKWRCCDCASLNRIRSPRHRKFVSHLARSLPAASFANSPANGSARYESKFGSEKSDGVSAATTAPLSDLEKAIAALDAAIDRGSSFDTASVAATWSGAEVKEAASTVQSCWVDGCEHVRCGDCFDVNGQGKLISRCSGQMVDEREYLTWCYLKVNKYEPESFEEQHRL